MAGRRYGRFRSGDLNEEFGQTMLRHLAAVAPVPRQEDVGIDAVATLLRPDGDMLIAEDSFYVQFKSASDRVVDYDEHEVRWLEALKLPFFIGSVDRDKSSIALYATHRLSQVFSETRHKGLRLFLDSGKEPGTSDVRCVNIGPPLLRWTSSDIASKDFGLWGYERLKPYVVAEQRNIGYRPIRYCEQIRWTTNELPSVIQSHMLASGGADDTTVQIIRDISPYLMALSTRFFSAKDKMGYALCVALVQKMRLMGFDPDPNNIYESMLFHFDLAATDHLNKPSRSGS